MKLVAVALALLVSAPASANMTGHFAGTARLTCASNNYVSTVSYGEARIFQIDEPASTGNQLSGDVKLTLGDVGNTFQAKLRFDTRYDATRNLMCSDWQLGSSWAHAQRCGSIHDGVARLTFANHYTYLSVEDHAWIRPNGAVTMSLNSAGKLVFELPLKVYSTACFVKGTLEPIFP